MTIIYHNPRCSKSRKTLLLLQENGVDPTVIEYLKSPPSETELDQILLMLKQEPEALMRRGEDEYKAHFKEKALSRDESIALLVKFPKVIERPIVVHNGKAAIGRPPESVLEIL
ncbi:MAG: arsenate reductase (glutaredoxin) [Mariprofundaceae bacterium]